jgi:hypothetical protein
MSELHAAEPQPPGRIPIAFECEECGQVWTVQDNVAEWAFGHDCEEEPESPVGVIVESARWVDDEEYTQIGDHPGTDHGQRSAS